jgi:hypothetical protein
VRLSAASSLTRSKPGGAFNACAER